MLNYAGVAWVRTGKGIRGGVMPFARFWVLIGLLLLVGTVPGQGQEKKPMLYTSPYYPLRVGNQWALPSDDRRGAPPQKVFVTVEQAEPHRIQVCVA